MNLHSNLRIELIYKHAILTVCVFVLFVSIFYPNTSNALTTTPRLEIAGDPGETIRTTLKLTNEESSSRVYYLRAENFNAQDETGAPTFLPRREGFATWINLPEKINISSGETIELPVNVNVPKNADPGGHFAAIFFLTDPPDNSGDRVSLAISAKLGSLILLRVNGDFLQDANILEFSTTNKQRFFTGLPIQFYYRFQNTGEDHLKPLGDIQIKDIFGRSVKILSANTLDGSVLPKSIRRFNSVWSDHNRGDKKQIPQTDLPSQSSRKFWPQVVEQARNFTFGKYTAELKIVFGTKELQSENAKFVFYIIPWQLLSVAVPTFIILILILYILIKKYNQYIINKARANQ